MNVTAVLNGETVYSEVIEPRNTRLISIPLQGGTCMADVLIDGEVYKSASVDFATGQYTGRPTILRPLVSKWRGLIVRSLGGFYTVISEDGTKNRMPGTGHLPQGRNHPAGGRPMPV